MCVMLLLLTKNFLEVSPDLAGFKLDSVSYKYLSLHCDLDFMFLCTILLGTTPSTVSNKDWWEETDKKFQAWPRTAGPPVVMNPISRQNFIVKNRID